MSDDKALSGVPDSVKPWTIKSISTEVRDMAIAAARRDNPTTGQWLERVIRAEVEGHAPAPGRSLALSGPAPQGLSTAELADMMRAAQAIAEASGQLVPPALARTAFAALRRRLRS